MRQVAAVAYISLLLHLHENIKRQQLERQPVSLDTDWNGTASCDFMHRSVCSRQLPLTLYDRTAQPGFWCKITYRDLLCICQEM